MPLMIRKQRTVDLARQLARRRGQTMTDAVTIALENEIRRDDEERPLAERLKAIADDLKRMSKGPGREVTKEELDSLWGHDDIS